MPNKPRYLSQAEIARKFQVTKPAVRNWINRFPAGGAFLPTPEPDAFVGVRPLWLEESFWKWEQWFENRNQMTASGYTRDSRSASVVV